MTALNPPAVAVWLLQRLRNDSLLGDLYEEFNMGRSAWWFWRQTAIVMCLGCYRDIGAHKLLTARAMLTYALVGYAVQQLLYVSIGSSYNSLLRSHPEYGWALFLLVGAMTPSLIQGWLVGRLHRRHQAAMVVAVAVAVLLTQLPELARRSGNALEDARYMPALIDFLCGLVVSVTGLLVGGFVVRPLQDEPAIAPANDEVR